MANHKLTVEDVFEDEYALIAIHCTEEAYKIAFLLNTFADLRLRRKERDLDFSYNGTDIFYPIFDFEDKAKYMHYTLVANRCRSNPVHVLSSGGLFDEAESSVVNYLLPEMKHVDYFLKVYSEFQLTPVKELTASIQSIKQVISAYCVETEAIKQKNHLIFD